jgi:hypothetical protein
LQRLRCGALPVLIADHDDGMMMAANKQNSLKKHCSDGLAFSASSAAFANHQFCVLKFKNDCRHGGYFGVVLFNVICL